MKPGIKKTSELEGVYSLWFSIPFSDVETNESFIECISESTINFILENEGKDYLDFVKYHDEVYDLILSFIKENSSGYFDRLKITSMLFSEPKDFLFSHLKILYEKAVEVRNDKL
jgi:hypothetical protein